MPTVMRRAAPVACTAVFLALVSGTAGAQPSAPRSWAAPQITAVVGAGLMAPSVAAFRPDDVLTWSEFATVLSTLGMEVAVVDPARPVTMRELDAQLVTVAGLRPEARAIRLAARDAGLAPTPWLGTETVARLLGFRINHLMDSEQLELQLAQPATRAEAAYSVARFLTLTDVQIEAVRQTASTFTPPALTEWQRTVLTRALRFVGSPYVFAGTSEKPQIVFGKPAPGGFDCSGFVWRVYKLQPFAGAPALPAVLTGRSSYEMSGEVRPSSRITRNRLQPGDIAFFGNRGPSSKPSEVGHMGIYLGNGWIAHSSRFGTTLQPMVDWYDTTFAWGRRPLAEAGIA
jgi:cell wall-associated NlpC family hydrolase